MPVSFSRLRIAGFKSFAEPVSVELLPGLTGIVGPNGCGKSNVVEALRWAMGESSARTLRGGEMDDVIFAGTAHRASRNIAEVTLSLDDTLGLAPQPFHEAPELEVARRIERGVGSSFRINGREARARDVQTLFADLATGARSSAMVSQGRVHSIVTAAASERRGVLEEAAGITGLHARRHEAELKLRGAEANLARAGDLRVQLAVQLDGLQRQAKQAARFRLLADAVRLAETELLAVQCAIVEQARDAARRALATAQADRATAIAEASATGARAAEAAALLPGLRHEESAARTALERARLLGQQEAAEVARAEATLAAAAARRQQLGRDLGHTEHLQRDADAAATRLAAEEARLAQEEAAHPPRLERAATEAVATAQALQAAEAAALSATEAAAELVARHRAATEAAGVAEQRAQRTGAQLARLEAECQRAASQGVADELLRVAETERDAAERQAGACRVEAEAAELARPATQQALAAARATATQADAAQARLAATVQALAETLAVKDSERWPRMIDQLTVPPGMEAAFGAALGEELDSAADADAARHWRLLPALEPLPPLPAGAEPLAAMVQAPPALARALSQLGLVADDAAGDAAMAELAPGQMLASRAGAVWRWDGYRIRAGAPTAAVVRLRQRNRLAAARGELATATEAAAAAWTLRGVAEAEERSAAEVEQRARGARRDAEQRLERARTALGTLTGQAASAAARLTALTEQRGRAGIEHEEADAARVQAAATLAALADPARGRAEMERARTALTAARTAERAAGETHEALLRAAKGRAHRARTLANERQDWRLRTADFAGRLADLTARAAEAQAEHATLAAAPARLALHRTAALAELAASEAAQRRAAEALGRAETAAAAADRAGRSAEAVLAAARERLVRAEGELAQASHAWGSVAERIVERLGGSPALPDIGALVPDSEERARRKLERLQREREAMGLVNLRAELEAAAIEEQVATIATEGEALSTAIAKLRGSIGHINREGRERLGQVFADIDRHFQALFARMFNGGHAHLALVGSDDPLTAGLEIYAQPPGKKLAALSLLSGGEQALTALSLIFAVFRCNPAPICVLDEVDAPLDDANVERFCTLLAEMVRETGTRFLVVTHHQVTMARMDRLYGVTMQERGVSRVLSVDLQRAVAMIDHERIAAE